MKKISFEKEHNNLSNSAINLQDQFKILINKTMKMLQPTDTTYLAMLFKKSHIGIQLQYLSWIYRAPDNWTLQK